MTAVAKGGALAFSAAKVRALRAGKVVVKRRTIGYNPAYIAQYKAVPPADWARECPRQPGDRSPVRGHPDLGVEVARVAVVYAENGMPRAWDVSYRPVTL